jgi:predicted DCC family thiol-disulfide oxidoreductase YuxK
MSTITHDALPDVLPKDRPVLVYDGDCGFCSRAVQFVLAHEKRHDLVFITRASELGMVIRRHFRLEAVESMLWVEDGTVKTESDSALRVAAYVGGWCRMALLAYVIPRKLRNWGYRLIARNRQRLSGESKSCVLPTPEQRSRFLA